MKNTEEYCYDLQELPEKKRQDIAYQEGGRIFHTA
jgi:hypothetical protein